MLTTSWDGYTKGQVAQFKILTNLCIQAEYTKITDPLFDELVKKINALNIATRLHTITRNYQLECLRETVDSIQAVARAVACERQDHYLKTWTAFSSSEDASSSSRSTDSFDRLIADLDTLDLQAEKEGEDSSDSSHSSSSHSTDDSLDQSIADLSALNLQADVENVEDQNDYLEGWTLSGSFSESSSDSEVSSE